MADHSYLQWPFFDESHRALHRALDTWAAKEIDQTHHHDVDQTCRDLVKQLGSADWLAYAVGGQAYGGRMERIDTRSICLLRENLARYSGLADFAFAMFSYFPIYFTLTFLLIS